MSNDVTFMLLSGKICAGKDTLARAVVEADPRYTRVSYADALKRDVAGFHHISIEELEANKADYREELQKYGVACREQYGADYWVLRLLEYVTQLELSHVVIADVRFPNEIDTTADWWYCKDVMRVRLVIPQNLQCMRYRALYGVDLSEERMQHISETALDDKWDWDIALQAGLPTDIQVKMIHDYSQRRRFDFMDGAAGIPELARMIEGAA